MFWTKKKTKEQEMQHRIDDVFMKLTSDADFSFTELEVVQILNGVREKLNIHLSDKISDNKSKSIDHEQRANEIINAKSLLK